MDAAWRERRLAELQAAAPAKKRKKVESFIKVTEWWIRAATKATHTKKALVAVELLRASWKAGGATTFALPSGRLKRFGVSDPTTWRALQDLRRAGLITIEQRGQKAPLISFPVTPW
jgi:hypothetical protein